jgi:hypothetical protein
MIVGVSVVRNEADILALTIRHHLREGLDLALIADNDSDDGTRVVLRRLAAHDRRIRWFRASGEFHQADMATELAQSARELGALWIVPFDADEFWHAPGGLLRAVAGRPEAALEVQVVNYVQRREQHVLEPDSLLRIDRRIAQPLGPPGSPDMVEAEQISLIEMRYPTKWISRAGRELEIGPGNHTVRGTAGPTGAAPAIRCLHVPLRARDLLHQKAAHGRRLDAAGYEPLHGWHVRRIGRLSQQGGLEREWEVNSHQDGVLTAPDGRVVPLVQDATIRRLVAPLLDRRRLRPPRWPRLRG